MATQINNNGASLRITEDGQTRNIMKHQIVEISIIKDTVLKIDIGQGALYNVFINHADVDDPKTDTPIALKDSVNAMLDIATTGLPVGAATEAKQTTEIENLHQLNTSMDSVKATLIALDSKQRLEPLLIDEGNPNTIYKGFAVSGSSTKDAVWAIQRINYKGGISSYQWAGGKKTFENIWDNRTKLIYA